MRALQVAQVGRRNRLGGEQGEGGRVGGSLGGVQDPATRRAVGGLGFGQDPVELAGRHPLLGRRQRGPQGRVQAVHPQAGPGADLEHRGVGQKAQAVLEVRDHPGPLASASSSSHLLRMHHYRVAGRVHPFGQPLILAGDAIGGVEDQEGGVGPVEGLEGPNQRVVLGALAPPWLAGACRLCRRT